MAVDVASWLAVADLLASRIVAAQGQHLLSGLWVPRLDCVVLRPGGVRS